MNPKSINAANYINFDDNTHEWSDTYWRSSPGTAPWTRARTASIAFDGPDAVWIENMNTGFIIKNRVSCPARSSR